MRSQIGQIIVIAQHHNVSLSTSCNCQCHLISRLNLTVAIYQNWSLQAYHVLYVVGCIIISSLNVLHLLNEIYHVPTLAPEVRQSR